MATKNSLQTRFIHVLEVGSNPSTYPKWPPVEVVTSRVCGLLENSFNGRAEEGEKREGSKRQSRTDIDHSQCAGTKGSSVAVRQSRGVVIL